MSLGRLLIKRKTGRSLLCIMLLACSQYQCLAWGFEAHNQITRLAIVQLPAELLPLYRSQVDYLAAASLAPDRRRYVNPVEGPRHYFSPDMLWQLEANSARKLWGQPQDSIWPLFTSLERRRLGTLPWHLLALRGQLVDAMAARKPVEILRLSAEVSHYMADAHVPLHCHPNYNGQLTGQLGVHALWETAVPATGLPRWLLQPSRLKPDAPYGRDHWHGYIWDLIRKGYDQADTVLRAEQEQRRNLPPSDWYMPSGKGLRGGYSLAFQQGFIKRMQGMVQRNMLAASRAIALFWFGAWVEAGQPQLVPALPGSLPPGLWNELEHLRNQTFQAETEQALEELKTGHNCGPCCQD